MKRLLALTLGFVLLHAGVCSAIAGIREVDAATGLPVDGRGPLTSRPDPMAILQKDVAEIGGPTRGVTFHTDKKNLTDAEWQNVKEFIVGLNEEAKKLRTAKTALEAASRKADNIVTFSNSGFASLEGLLGVRNNGNTEYPTLRAQDLEKAVRALQEGIRSRDMQLKVVSLQLEVTNVQVNTLQQQIAVRDIWGRKLQETVDLYATGQPNPWVPARSQKDAPTTQTVAPMVGAKAASVPQVEQK